MAGNITAWMKKFSKFCSGERDIIFFVINKICPLRDMYRLRLVKASVYAKFFDFVEHYAGGSF